jgi:bifunctional non-homologous end joining protein LigD
MSLHKYREKRNFTQSPEPAGDESLRVRRAAVREKTRFFCVQKHLASHLHYDFRLEHDGVLLSWAVPKGPSLDPRTKRLAMQVEDHPIEYGTFEGVIPSGYGAGIVMLWDQGAWTPQVADVGAALKKGDLKFTLDGYKLKGSWALVRTSGRGSRPDYGSKPSWLLIKHRDDWSGELDITEFAPLSVKSEGDFADILAEENPGVWVSNRPAKTGDAGRMLARIIERAAQMKAERDAASRATTGAAESAKGARKTPGATAARSATGAKRPGAAKNPKKKTGKRT